MRQQTKEYSVMRMTTFCATGLVLVMTAAAAAQDKPAPAPASPAAPAPAPASPAAPAPVRQQVPLKIQLVLSRYQGEKKLSSVPYVLWVTSNENRTSSLRMGVSIPIPTGGGGGGYSYREVGTNIDCVASSTADGAYRLVLTVNDSSVYFSDRDRTAAGGQVPVNLASPPSLRTFTSNFTILVRDGQTAQYTSATDQVSGEQLKIDATLNVLK